MRRRNSGTPGFSAGILLGTWLSLFAALPAAAQLQCTTPSDHLSYNFNLNCPDGWSCVNATSSCVPGASGYFKILPTTTDPQAMSGTVCFGPSAHDYMRVEIRSFNTDNHFQLFFRNGSHDFSPSFTKTWTLNNNGAWHYYTMPLSGTHPTLGSVTGWFTTGTNGNISRVRLDPANASSGEVDYAGVWFRRDDKPPFTPVVDNVSQSGSIVTVAVHGDDPPPTFSNGTNPDLYGSGVYDFGWSVDAPGGPQNWVVNSGNDVFTGTATGSIDVDVNTLGAGCHTVYVWSRDRCGWVSTFPVSTQIVGLPFSITASAGAGGSISPSGSVSVNCGASQGFTITPAACEQVADVLVDGASVGARTSYTFTNVQANHSISASFTTAPGYTITASAGPNGSISPSGSITVPCGGSQTFTMSPSACYHVSNLLVDGSSVGAPSSYTFPSVSANHSISVSFAINTFTINASAGTGGSITPSGPVAVNCGAGKTFTITPGTCSVISDVLVDATSVGAVPSYTFNNVQTGHTISAIFTASSGSLPGAPAGLAVVNLGTGSSLHVSWSTVSGATSYVLRRVNGSNTIDTPLNGTQADVTSLTRTTIYAFSVRAVNGCGPGPFGRTVSRAPDWYPVLLVHGICGSSADFTQCSLSGLGELTCTVPNPVLLGDVLKSAGVSHVFAITYANNARLATVAPTVAQRIKDILAATGETQLNIIAHSQGGLLSRYATQTLGMSSRVANIVMIGTPNHGSEWAKWMIAAPALQPSWMKQVRNALGLDCLATGEAGYDLVPGSTFLNQLNYGNNTSHYDALANDFNPFHICPSHYSENLPSSTQCWLILGTGGWCNLPGAAKGSVGLCEPNDGVVSVANGRLIGLSDFYSRSDVGLDPAPARHPRATHFGGSTQFRGRGAGCNLEELKHPTLISAAYQIVTSGTLPGAPNAMPARTMADAIDLALPVIQIADDSGEISAGSTLRDTVVVGSAKTITFLQGAEQGGLELAVIDPAGARWSAADTVSGTLGYEGDPEAGLQALTFGSPAQGPWVVESSGSSMTQSYSTAAFVQADTLLSGELISLGQDSLRVRCAYFGPNGTIGNAQLTALLARPDSSSIAVAIFDDGVHGDSLAGDGIYGAALPIDRGPGAYVLRVDGSLRQGDLVLEHQQVFATTVVQPLPDLQIDPAAVIVTRVPGSADSLSVSAIIRNVGPAAARGALIQFEEPEGLFATQAVDIESLGVVTLSANWRPSRMDSSSVLVYVDRASPFLQSRYDNDSVLTVVHPSTLAVEDLRVPGVMWLASPTPNPVVGNAIIRFGLPKVSGVTLRVYDVAGRKVATLVDGIKAAGTYAVPLHSAGDGRHISPGIYFLELRAEDRHIVRRAVLLR